MTANPTPPAPTPTPPRSPAARRTLGAALAGLVLATLLAAAQPAAAAGVIAQHPGVITSGGSHGSSGTFISFVPASGAAPVQVTYSYCYGGDTNWDPASIRTVFDGQVVDDLGFTEPATSSWASQQCVWDNPATFATRSFVSSVSVLNSVRFDYTNGDWLVQIAAITVTAAAPVGIPVGVCDPPSSVGVQAPGAGTCQRVPSVGVCNYGVVVDGTRVCAGVPSVSACDPPATVGAAVNGLGACVAPPTASRGADATVHMGAFAAVRAHADVTVRPSAAGSWATGTLSPWAAALAADLQGDAGAAAGGNLAPLLNDAVGLIGADPPSPVGSVYGPDGAVRVQSGFEPAAPRTPQCYGVQDHSGLFPRPLHACSPFLP